jgi:hypothetical protein
METMKPLDLTHDERMAAYAAVKERYGLKWQQRDKLDASPIYMAIMRAAHQERWADCHRLLWGAGVIA